MSTTLEKLERVYRDKSLCEIYDVFGDEENFNVGYVIGFDDEYAIFELFGLLGQYEGYACLWLELIEDIVPDTDYTNRIKRLTNLQGFTRNYPEINISTGCINSVVRYIVEEKKVCEMRLNDLDADDESAFGYITSLCGIEATICPLDEDGREEDEFTFDIEELDLLLVCGPELECLALLHDNPEHLGESQ